MTKPDSNVDTVCEEPNEPVEITLYNLSSSEVIGIVYELKSQSIKMGVDFDFAFVSSRTYVDVNGMYEQIPKHVVFRFYTTMYASWFALKYG